jgi:hypothetical protein
MIRFICQIGLLLYLLMAFCTLSTNKIILQPAKVFELEQDQIQLLPDIAVLHLSKGRLKKQKHPGR